MRAGYAAFPISTRNSPAAVAHLLKKAGVAHVLVGHESALQALISDALALIEDDEERPKPTISVMLANEDVYRNEEEDQEDFVPLEPRTYHPDDPAFLFHSSGSTAFPKPIVWTHYQSVQLSLTPCSFFRFFSLFSFPQRTCDFLLFQTSARSTSRAAGLRCTRCRCSTGWASCRRDGP